MKDDFTLREKMVSLNGLIAYHVTLIESLKQDLCKPTQSIEIELGLLRKLTEAIVHLRELREMRFQMQSSLGQLELGELYVGVGAVVDCVPDDRLEV